MVVLRGVGWVSAGDIVNEVDVQEGFDNIPQTLQRLSSSLMPIPLCRALPRESREPPRSRVARGPFESQTADGH